MKPRNRNSDRRRKPEYQMKIAKERVGILLDEAVKARTENPNLSRRYFQLAKKIGMRYNMRMPRSAKRSFCKKCFSYLGEGWRFKKGRAYVKCRNCGFVKYYPYKPFLTKKKR